MKQFLQRWLINTVAVLMAVYLVHGIHYEKPMDLLVASLLLGFFNAFLRPILLVLALPLLLLTLGLFTFVINGLVLYFVGYLLQPHFSVAGFWPAVWGGVVISIVSLFLNSVTGTGNSRVSVHRGAPNPPPPNKDDSGPVIDV